MKKLILGAVIALMAIFGLAAQPANAGGVGDWPHGAGIINVDNSSHVISAVGDWPHG